MAADNMTGCLPDVWQFCKPRPADDYTNLMCPFVAYRRPVKPMANQLVQVMQVQMLFYEPANCNPCISSHSGIGTKLHFRIPGTN